MKLPRISAAALLPVLLFYFAGIALVQGFWHTTAAIFFPPYAIYVVVEQALIETGLMPECIERLEPQTVRLEQAQGEH